MNARLQTWVTGMGDACRTLRSSGDKMSRERLAVTLSMSISTIIRWEKRPDPQLLFRCHVQDFQALYKKKMKQKPKVSLFTTKENAEKSIQPKKKLFRKKH